MLSMILVIVLVSVRAANTLNFLKVSYWEVM